MIPGTMLPDASLIHPKTRDSTKIANGAGIWSAWMSAKIKDVRTIGSDERPLGAVGRSREGWAVAAKVV